MKKLISIASILSLLSLLFPLVVQASGLQSSFTGSSLKGLTRFSTAFETDMTTDVSGNLLDISGWGRTLTATGTAATAYSSLQNSDGRKIQGKTVVNTTTYYSRSAEAWMKLWDTDHTITVVFRSPTTAAGADVLMLNGSSTANGGAQVQIDITNNRVTASYYKTGTGTGAVSSLTPINDGYIHVYQAIRKDNLVVVYLDGNPGAIVDMTGYGLDITSNFYLGYSTASGMDGDLFYFRIDTEALSLDRLNYERGQIMGIGPRSGTADISWDFSRASTATQTYSEGYVGTHGTNMPRVGGDGGGFLIEASRENKCLQSQTLGTTWTQTALTSITSDGAVAPDGTNTADGLVGTAADTQHGVEQAVTLTAASWTHSVYAKPGDKNWLYVGDLVGDTWSLMNPATKPSARQYMAMDFDTSRNISILFGGNTGARNQETWEYNGTNWTQKAPVSKPSARDYVSMAYAINRGVSVLFGGNTAGGANDETWEYDSTADSWTQKASGAVTKPLTRYYHAMAFDSSRNVIVLFGGYRISTGNLDDTWEWDGTDWVQKASGAVPKPSARQLHGMAFDSSRNVTVLFGGTDAGGLDAETWEWDGTDWVQKFPASSPGARNSMGMAFDSNRGKVVLFGGFDAVGRDAETWEYDGTNWTQLSPSSSPGARYGLGMSFDSSRKVTVLFGGNDGAVDQETWEKTGLSYYAYFDLANGKVGTTSSATGKIETLANGYKRASMTAAGTAASHTIQYYSADSDTDNITTGDTSTVNTWFWGAQSELGSQPSSYIPTTAASVTRSADTISIRPYKIGKGMQLGGERMWVDFSQDATAATITTNGGGYTLTKGGTIVRRNEYVNGEYYHVFNGTDSKYSIASSDFNPAGNFSVVAIFTPNTVTGSHIIASKYTATADQRGWSLYQTDDDMSISRTTNGQVGTLLAANVNNCLAIGRPVLVTATYSTTAGLWIKVDAFTAGTNAGATGTVHPSTYDFVIGDHGTGAKFNGNMHYLAFLDHGIGGTVLTEAQHNNLYSRFKQANILPPKIGTSYVDKKLYVEFDAKCPYTGSSDVPATEMQFLDIGGNIGSADSNTNRVTVHMENGTVYASVYPDGESTERYMSTAVTTANNWHRYKFYFDFAALGNSTGYFDTTLFTNNASLTGAKDLNFSDTAIRIGADYSGTVNNFCTMKNLRIWSAP